MKGKAHTVNGQACISQYWLIADTVASAYMPADKEQEMAKRMFQRAQTQYITWSKLKKKKCKK